MALRSFPYSCPVTQNIISHWNKPNLHHQISVPPYSLYSSFPVDDMAVVGNLPLLLDVISPRTIVLDRKTRSIQSDVLLNFFKKEPNHTPNPNLCTSLSTSGFEFENESRNKRAGARGKINSKVNNAVDYESSSDDEANGNGYEDDEETDGETYDWEKEMRKRLKEIEEMKELEKKAEELQSRMADEGGDNDGEETEEQKRMRVRKELEKVRFLSYYKMNN